MALIEAAWLQRTKATPAFRKAQPNFDVGLARGEAGVATQVQSNLPSSTIKNVCHYLLQTFFIHLTAQATKIEWPTQG
ncbi:hypothetical protein [Sphingobium lactosutens]|uniref:hypothetical protein n=1 Tax=Sphingobium lactosutens TaxID=522773 RepID=UPI0015B974D8|nr:hypothetical protein [Sphingobium lactosutens]